MTPVAKRPGLLKRGGVYHLRVVIPLDLRDTHEGRTKIIKPFTAKKPLYSVFSCVHGGWLALTTSGRLLMGLIN